MGFRSGVPGWLIDWVIGGAGVGLTAALWLALASHLLPRRLPRLAALVTRLAAARWRTCLLVAGLLVLSVGLALGAAGRFDDRAVFGLTFTVRNIGMVLAAALSYLLIPVIGVAVMGMMLGGFLGALYGVLGGLTGPEIERRARPNQGIWQSARNASVFASIGGLLIGVPYGIVNVAAGAAMTQTLPGPTDWMRLAVSPAISFAVLGGLVPAAACIQHFVLRGVLTAGGFAPWRYAPFLDYATGRLLLQRIGGRYRFIHDLLRDHLAETAPARSSP
jgi:hypothetical protein